MDIVKKKKTYFTDIFRARPKSGKRIVQDDEKKRFGIFVKELARKLWGHKISNICLAYETSTTQIPNRSPKKLASPVLIEFLLSDIR